jgi:hypothetical protein
MKIQILALKCGHPVDPDYDMPGHDPEGVEIEGVFWFTFYDKNEVDQGMKRPYEVDIGVDSATGDVLTSPKPEFWRPGKS